MTLAEYQVEIYEMTGEQGDLYDVDTTTYDAKLTTAINEGIRTVATWKDPQTGKAMRYPKVADVATFQAYYTSGDLTDDGSTSTVVLPTGASTANDAYNGWSIKVGSEERLIVDYVGATLTATVTPVFGTAPADEDEYSLSKNFIQLLPATDALIAFHYTKPTGMIIPLQLLNLSDKMLLERAPRVENYVTTRHLQSSPTEFYFQDDQLIFNSAFDDEYWYEMEYTRLPAELSASTDEPELPEAFHYGVVLWGRWWGYARVQAHPEAYAAKQDFIDFMRQRTGVYHFEGDRTNQYLTVRRR